MSMNGVPYVRVCLQGEGAGWESAFQVSLTGSGSSLHCVKANAVRYEENRR